MANVIIKAEQIVEAAALLLQREIVLPRLVWRQPDAAFVGSKDDTITLRVPAVRTAKTRTMRSDTPLVAADLAETKVPVQLDTHVYDLLKIRDEELSLDIRDFSAQVLNPQMRAVAEGLEDVVAGALASATVPDGYTLDADEYLFDSEDRARALALRCNRLLNEQNVPRTGRVLVLGSALEEGFLDSDKLSKVNESGSDSALRDAVVGRVAGFTVVGSSAIDPFEGYAFHQTAIALGIVAPALPDGAAMKARVQTEGIALRFLKDYDPTNADGPVDRSLVDAFAGAASVEEGPEGQERNKRLVKLVGEGVASS